MGRHYKFDPYIVTCTVFKHETPGRLPSPKSLMTSQTFGDEITFREVPHSQCVITEIY